MAPAEPTAGQLQTPGRQKETPQPADEPNYISDDDDDDAAAETSPRARRSKRVLRQQRIDDQQAMHRIVNLVTHETAEVPDLVINLERKMSRGLGHANEALQIAEWAQEELFVNAIVDKETGNSMEYRDLIKSAKHKVVWERALANKLGRLAQGIRDVEGTNTIEFIRRKEIPQERQKDCTYGRIVVNYRPQKKRSIERD